MITTGSSPSSARRAGFLVVALLAALLSTAGTTKAQIGVELLLDGLTKPLRLVAPAGDARLFVVQQNGLIRVFSRSGQPLGTFLDVSELTTPFGERGLLGLAFPPDYAQTGRFYIDYTDLAGDTQIVRYTVSADNPDRADPESASPVFSQDQPRSNHNGGHLEFGPDGFLYIGLGDGGGSGDPDNYAQNPNSLLGKLLRIDVGVPEGYVVPPSNPFVAGPPRDEIWALGLRNPWCFAFDRLTGDLYIADVGQAEIEEISIQPANSQGGENYGWRLMEGSQCYNPPTDCNPGGLTLPVHEYSHGGSPYRCSIAGGYVYRGESIPEIAGHYFFADYCSNQIWSLRWSLFGGVSEVVEWTAELTPPGGYGAIAAFGQDGFGELYVLDLQYGRVYRIVAMATPSDSLPRPQGLEQNVPNPFNPQTTIAYTVAVEGATVSLDVLDSAGRHVITLVRGPQPAGRRTVVWDGRDAAGRELPAGTYLYRLQTPQGIESRKMLLLK